MNKKFNTNTKKKNNHNLQKISQIKLKMLKNPYNYLNKLQNNTQQHKSNINQKIHKFLLHLNPYKIIKKPLNNNMLTKRSNLNGLHK
jgi:hypothetical protein